MAKFIVDTDHMKSVGKNVCVELKGDYIVIAVKTGISLGLSSTGNMDFLAMTEGWKDFPLGYRGKVFIGVNLNGG